MAGTEEPAGAQDWSPVEVPVVRSGRMGPGGRRWRRAQRERHRGASMSMNEADTRYHLIDPVLRTKGYVSRDQITLETILTPPPVEPTGAKGRRRKGPGRTDYLL
eukprot:TRINITY_DN1845_c0_g1_i8.p3 TRINITY_DN1845_c0_g1~~TRINITY_DN1845_c0_g1_i8.p3  ORF type:complete len:105 (+),score=9.36 TRINITY_DN1845_c0_g1_i8:543-857(+)